MRLLWPLLSLATIAATVTACGASIHAVYEGDVRFEHCMALDSRPDVRPTIRGACWSEWLDFYTFGQTRDRVEYAEVRGRQLRGTSDFDDGDAPAAQPDRRPVPAPSNAPPKP